MKVNQYGLQQSYKRAFNAIVKANLLQTLGKPNGDPNTNWGYRVDGTISPAALTSAINSAVDEAQNAVLSLSYLRLEQLLTTGANYIDFPILVNASGPNGANIRSSERRLALQDAFFTSSFQVYLAIAQSATDYAFRAESFPNVNIFPTGAAGNETVMPLNAFYNGSMSITINKNVIVPNYALLETLQIPQTQRLTTTSANQSNQFDPTECILLEPNLTFIGSKDSKIRLEFPQAISAVDAFTYVIIKINGTLAQNVTILS